MGRREVAPVALFAEYLTASVTQELVASMDLEMECNLEKWEKENNRNQLCQGNFEFQNNIECQGNAESRLCQA